VDHTPARDENTPAGRRETYRVLEDIHVLSGPRKRDPHAEVRRILVHSTGNAKGQQRARGKRLAKARDELDKLQRGAGGRYYNTPEKIAARIGVIAGTRRVTGCPHTEITTDDTGRPILHWHFDQDVLQTEAAVDGSYALLTTLTPADAAEVLRRHKRRQGTVERRYGDFKGPLAVTPVFVQDDKRVAALVAVICLALLVFCPIERQVRRALGDDQKMPGLYPGNQMVRPTGRMILYHLSGLRLRVGAATDPPTIVISRGIQLHLLDLLGLEPTHPRWPET
jgi:transposase